MAVESVQARVSAKKSILTDILGIGGVPSDVARGALQLRQERLDKTEKRAVLLRFGPAEQRAAEIACSDAW